MKKAFTRRTVDYSEKYSGMTMLDEQNFIGEMYSDAHPLMEKYKKDGYVSIDEKIKIHYETYFLPAGQNRGTIVMLHGFTGFTGKFYEVIYYCLCQNYSVVALDFRGHGYSYRELDDGHHAKTYIENFESYVSDTEKVYSQVVKPNANGKPILLYAHSMGGCVGVHLLEQHPDFFAGAVLSSPMLSVKTGGIPGWLVKLMSKVQIAKNGGTAYIPGAHDFDYSGEFTMKPSEAASFNRYAYYNTLRKPDQKYWSKYATYRWIFEAMRGGKLAIKNVGKLKDLKIPVLMFQSDVDNYVYPKEQKIFAENTPDIDVVFFPKSEHELFSSKNEILNAYYYEIFSFYDKVLNNNK